MDTIRIQYLLQRQAAGQLTGEELGELQFLLSDTDRESLLQTVSEWIDQESANTIQVRPDLVRDTFNKIVAADRIDARTGAGSAKPVHRIHFMRRWGWAAASIILLLATGAYYRIQYKDHRQQPAISANHRLPAEVPPGKNGAILTLADGKQIVLDSLGAGIVATQNGTKVVLKGDQLAYDPAEKNTGEVIYNTMSTPKGRQFHVRLPDGTGVWLNAASSIRYPTFFTGSERKVEVTGEAYFEVAENPKMPFKVNIDNRAEVEVLGTHFNVNAYSNEVSWNTTLLEGAVRINKGKETATLRPGQQAQITAAIKVVRDVDLNKVMAWKNGYFNFEGMKLREVMQQLERWYDIEVVYEDNVPDVSFYGELSRDLNLSGIIAALKDSDVHFRIEGKKLIVLP